jgi:hypothetical protein
MTPERIDDPRDQAAPPSAAANPAGASRLQSLRPVRRVAEPGSLGRMKSLFLFAIALLVSGCLSDENGTSSVPPPIKLTTRSALLDAAMIESWGAQKDFFVTQDFEIVPWEKAKAALLEDRIVGGKQYHTGWVTWYGSGGEKFLTRPIGYDDIYVFLREHGLKLKGFGTE